MRYVIVGNGGAGLRAAQAIRGRDPGGEITIVDREPYPCYYRMRLPDYISAWRDRLRQREPVKEGKQQQERTRERNPRCAT